MERIGRSQRDFAKYEKFYVGLPKTLLSIKNEAILQTVDMSMQLLLAEIGTHCSVPPALCKNFNYGMCKVLIDSCVSLLLAFLKTSRITWHLHYFATL